MILHVIRGSHPRVRCFSLDTGAAGTRIHSDIALVVPRFLTQEVDQGQVVERRLCCRIQGLLALKHTAGERGIEVRSTDPVEGLAVVDVYLCSVGKRDAGNLNVWVISATHSPAFSTIT